jgi:hypothetical protein
VTTTTEAPAVEPVTELSQQDRDRLMSQAYGVAQKRLREGHKDEFNGYYQEECASRGIEWTPRKSKQEQALDQIQDLLTEFPDLAEQLAARLAAQMVDPEDLR